MIQWVDKEFSVGIVKIDEQHKQLVGLINALRAKSDSNEHELISRILTTLMLYVRNHFTEEEKILRKINFPSFSAHHQQHKAFDQKLHQLRNEFEARGKSPELLADLTQFLEDWLVKHILIEDKAYSRYLLD